MFNKKATVIVNYGALQIWKWPKQISCYYCVRLLLALHEYHRINIVHRCSNYFNLFGRKRHDSTIKVDYDDWLNYSNITIILTCPVRWRALPMSQVKW